MRYMWRGRLGLHVSGLEVAIGATNAPAGEQFRPREADGSPWGRCRMHGRATLVCRALFWTCTRTRAMWPAPALAPALLCARAVDATVPRVVLSAARVDGRLLPGDYLLELTQFQVGSCWRQWATALPGPVAAGVEAGRRS